MRRGKPWTRFLAVLLTAAMLMTSQSIVSAADTVQDMIQSGKTAEDVSSQEEKEEPIATESDGTKEETGSEVKEETDKKNEDKKDEDKNTTSQKKETSDKKTDTDQKKTDQKETEGSGKQNAPAKKNEEQSLADKKSGVKLIYSSSQLPEDVKLQVEEKKETDTDYPKQAKEDIAAKLEKEENLSLTDITFYDIDLDGDQPSGKIEVKLPVPKNWTGELDAWYINGQGTVTYMDREKEDTEGYYTFKTDHFSLYALSVSEPKEEEKNTIEETQPAQQQKAPRIGDDGNAAFTSVEQMAEAYYGENATNPQTAGSVTISSSHTGSTVMAGDELSFTLTYTMNPAPLYNYGEQTKTLFDSYNNTEIRFKLPDGMTLIGEDDIDGATASYDKATGEWVFALDKSIDAGASSTGSFSIRVQVEGNGALEIGKPFNFDIQKNLSMTTEFTVYDKTDSAKPEKVKDYTQKNQTITQSLPTLTSTSQDKWGLAKSHVSNTVAEDKSTVTVRWELAFGLQTSEGGMVTNQASYYQAHGRVPFSSDGTITLKEALAVAGKEDLTPKSITVTEQFGDRKEYKVTNGTVEVATDTCGNHSVSGIDKGAPYYSEYFVDVVYDYEEFIAKYSDPDQDKLTVENTAQATYQLKGADDPVTVKDTADTQIGEVTQPAELIIEKYIEDYDGNGTRLYQAGDTWDPVSGPAEFTVTTKDGAQAVLYTKNADGTYTKLEGNTVSIDPATAGEDGKVTVYLDAGEYEITETKEPVNTKLQTDPQTEDIEEGKSQTVKFTNKELLGGVLIHKVGHINSENRDLQGAEFGIYSDEACEELVASGETNTSGNLQFDRLVPGTYYVKEIEAPEGYLILSRLVDTFFSRISLTMQPPPKPHSTACVLPWEEGRHWQSRSSGCSSS